MKIEPTPFNVHKTDATIDGSCSIGFTDTASKRIEELVNPYLFRLNDSAQSLQGRVNIRQED